MTRPVRIQLCRTKGFRLQEHSKALNGLPAIVVDRTSIFGNIFTRFVFDKKNSKFVKNAELCIPLYYDDKHRRKLVAFFEEMVFENEDLLRYGYPSIEEIRRELRGKNLACWCPLDQPCHADVLLRIANDWPDEAIAIAQRGGRK